MLRGWRLGVALRRLRIHPFLNDVDSIGKSVFRRVKWLKPNHELTGITAGSTPNFRNSNTSSPPLPNTNGSPVGQNKVSYEFEIYFQQTLQICKYKCHHKTLPIFNLITCLPSRKPCLHHSYISFCAYHGIS